MSLDYSLAAPVRFAVPADGAVANGTVAITRGFIFSYDQPYVVLGFQIYIIVAATSATQSVALQKSDTAGSFSSPTTLATIAIASTDAAGTKKTAAVAVASSDCVAGEVVRAVHIATATDATLSYVGDIIATPRYF